MTNRKKSPREFSFLISEGRDENNSDYRNKHQKETDDYMIMINNISEEWNKDDKENDEEGVITEL